MLKGIIFSAVLSMTAGLAYADVMELDHGLTIDMGNVKEVRQACIPGNASNTVPGTECITECYDLTNTTNAGYSCTLNASSSFYEVFVMTNGEEGTSTMETGNTLTATDTRTIPVYPYSTAKVCFNFGKYTGQGLWVYSAESANIEDSCLVVTPTEPTPPETLPEEPAPTPAH